MNIVELEISDIRVFIGDITGLEIEKTDFSGFSEYRLKKLSRIKNEKSMIQSAGAELVLIHAVEKCFGRKPPIEYYADERGKTYFKDIPAFFSLSHSGRYAVCAVAKTEVGIDVQEKRTANMRLAKRFFTHREYEYVKSDPKDNFNRIWARKEAFSKAAGDGIQIGFATTDVLDEYVEHNGERYRIYDILYDDSYSMAAAIICR